MEKGGLWVAGSIAVRNIPTALLQADTQTSGEQESALGATTSCSDWSAISPQDPDYSWAALLTAHQIRASLSVPIISAGRQIGGLALASENSRTWLSDEIHLLEAVGQQVGSAVERLDLLKVTSEQARQMQLIIDTVPEGVLLLDARQRIVTANPAARDYLANLLEQSDLSLPITRLADQSIQDLFDESLPSGWRVLQTSSEESRTYELAVRPLEVMTFNAGWVLVLRDVTEERLSLSKLQMQERLATVGQLAAGIAHDFNNIMAAIVVYSELIAADPNLSSKNRDQLKIINQQIQRATSLIRQILDFSRRAVMEPSPLDLLPFIKELDKLLGRTSLRTSC